MTNKLTVLTALMICFFRLEKCHLKQNGRHVTIFNNSLVPSRCKICN